MTDSGRRSFESPDEAPRLDVLVAQHSAFQKSQAATLIANGHVRRRAPRAARAYRAAPGERIEVDVPAPAGRPVVGESIPLTVSSRGRRRCSSSTSRRGWSSIRRPASGPGPRQRLEGPGHACPAGPTRAERGSSIAWTRDLRAAARRESDRAHRVLGAALQARQIVRRMRVDVGSPGRGPGHDRQADGPRPARPKAYGGRLYRTAGEDRSHSARALRLRRPFAGAPALRAHAPDPGARRVDRPSGRW